MTKFFPRHGRGRRTRGSASIEMLALTPMLILVAMAMLQIGLAAYAVLATGDAARAAARAASLHEDPQAAARNALPGGLSLESISGGHHGDAQTWTATVSVPRVFPIPIGDVSKTVSMPDIPL